jgi:hypothetical protein
MARTVVTLSLVIAMALLVNPVAIGDDGDEGGSGGSGGEGILLNLDEAQNIYDDLWVISGRVEGDPVSGLPVDFGGLGAGESTTTDHDGSFATFMRLTGPGPITATATAPNGEQAQDTVYIN